MALQQVNLQALLAGSTAIEFVVCSRPGSNLSPPAIFILQGVAECEAGQEELD